MLTVSVFVGVQMMAVCVFFCGTMMGSVMVCRMMAKLVHVDGVIIGLGLRQAYISIFLYFRFYVGDSVIGAQIRSDGELGKSIVVLFNVCLCEYTAHTYARIYAK